MNFLSPIAPAFCSARCPWPRCSSWFWQMWGFGVGLFHLYILCHFCPSNRANLFQQTRTGHSLPWKSWPEGLALAFGWPHERQWCLLPSPMSDHGFWDTFLSKSPDEGEHLLLWVLSMSDLEWNGTFYSEHQQHKPSYGGALLIALGPPDYSRSCGLTYPQGLLWGSYLFKNLFSLLD